MKLREILLSGAAAWGLSLPPDAPEAFETYCAVLREYNEVMDLTAVLEEEEIARRHFLDSLSLLRLEDFSGKRVIDVGSGAGFPGLPLLLARPDLSLTLLDAQQKRVDFLAELCRRLGVKAECVHARAEEEALKPDRRDSYDLAVSRAVARLNLLGELCLPFVRPGGALLAMKAADCAEELREASHALETLNATLERVETLEVAGVVRKVAVIRKLGPTPKGYPRRFAKIKKSPL